MGLELDLVGTYRLRGRAAVTILRLTIDLDGRFVAEHWMDFGGSWSRLAVGVVEREGAVLHLRTEHRRPWHHLRGPLAIHDVEGVVHLVPEGEPLSEAPWDIFVKQPFPRAVVCRDPERFALTAGRSYLVLAEDLDQGRVQLTADNRRLRWFPAACFGPSAPGRSP